MLVSVDEADAVLVDRWTILLDAHGAAGAENSVLDAEPPKVLCGLWPLLMTLLCSPAPSHAVGHTAFLGC